MIYPRSMYNMIHDRFEDRVPPLSRATRGWRVSANSSVARAFANEEGERVAATCEIRRSISDLCACSVVFPRRAGY